MRLAPVPIAFASDESLFLQGLKFAEMQSKVTHSGEEASEACRLLAHLIMRLINYESNNIKNNDKNKTHVAGIQTAIDECLSDFPGSKNYSINCIKESKEESEYEFYSGLKQNLYYKEANSSPQDRNWNWRTINYKYSVTREELNPGYVGSYALDALTMALNISYHSKNPKEAIIKAANMGGDCDTVAAIVGQIVGAYYGLDKDIIDLYEGVMKYDDGKIAYMAYKLFTSKKKES